MLAGNQNPFFLGHSPAFQTPACGFVQQSPFGQPTYAWPCKCSAPVHTYIHHVVGPSTAGTCGHAQQTPAFGQQVLSSPFMSTGHCCTFVHHVIGPTVATSSTSSGPFGNLTAAANQPSTSSAPAFANTAFGLTTQAPSMMSGLYWSNTGHPWRSNSATSGQPSTSTAPASGGRASGPFGAPLGNSAPSSSGRLFGSSDMNVDQNPVFSAPAFGRSFAGSNAGQPGCLFNTSGTMSGRQAFGFGEPNNGLVFRAMNQQQPATCGNQFGAPSTPMNKPWPQPSFSTPTTHVACPACGAFVGTTIKYEPSCWIDSTTMNGGLSLVYVARQCITCMKEYEHKSLEELRLEDYSADRKYGSKMAAGVFHNTASRPASSVFSQPFAPTLRPSLLFGDTENKAPLGTSATPGALFGSSAPAVNFSGAPVTTSSASSMAAAVPASVFGAPLTTSSCGPAMTRQVAPSIFGTPVMTSSHGSNTASLVTATASGTPETFPSYTSMSTSPAFGTPVMPSPHGSAAVAFGSAFGAPVNGFTDTSLGVPELLSSHGPTATSSVVFSPAFGAPAVFGAPMMTSPQRPTATRSVGFNPSFGSPAVFRAPIMTPLQAPRTTSSVGFGSLFGAPVMTSSHGPTATSSGGFGLAFGTSAVFGAPIMTSLHGPTTTSSVATSTSGTLRNTSLSSAMVASPVAASISGTPVTTSTSSSTTESVAATVIGAPLTSHNPAKSVAARMFGAPIATSSYTPIEISSAAVADPSVTTSSHDSVKINAAVAADNIGTSVTTLSSSSTATSSEGIPIVSPATAGFGTPVTASICSSTTKSTGPQASPCTEPNTAPFGFESWWRALRNGDNGRGDSALPAERQPSGVAREHPSSHDNVAPPGAVCAICLGPLQHKSSTDSCSHTFCYTCLIEWARVKLECPVCKERFKNIVQSDPSQE